MNAERVSRQQHSAGPWHPSGTSVNERYIKIVNANGEIVCLIPAENPTAGIDAALIAAAPELQDANKPLLRWIEGKGAHTLPRQLERRIIYANMTIVRNS